MHERASVERAKGVLMLHYGIGSYEALAVLERWSRDSGEPLVGIARAITHGICQGHSDGRSEDRLLVRWLEQRFRQDLTTSAGLAGTAVNGRA
jgi:hypothetical protein